VAKVALLPLQLQLQTLFCRHCVLQRSFAIRSLEGVGPHFFYFGTHQGGGNKGKIAFIQIMGYQHVVANHTKAMLFKMDSNCQHIQNKLLMFLYQSKTFVCRVHVAQDIKCIFQDYDVDIVGS
jgi:hypothetical protein